jgi:hypothetical protein
MLSEPAFREWAKENDAKVTDYDWHFDRRSVIAETEAGRVSYVCEGSRTKVSWEIGTTEGEVMADNCHIDGSRLIVDDEIYARLSLRP